MEKIFPVALYDGKFFSVLLMSEMTPPIIRVGGSLGNNLMQILTKKYEYRNNNGKIIINLPLTHLPALTVWVLASIGKKPDPELLERLLRNTPKVIADIVWELVFLSGYYNGERKALIHPKVARKASKIIRGLIELYEVS